MGIGTINVPGPDVEAYIRDHNMDLEAHPSIQLAVEDVELRLKHLELKHSTNVTDNAFSVTFASLDGVEAAGVWNQALARIEF